MKKILFLSLASLLIAACSTSSSMGNFVATMQIDEAIPGLCDKSKVYCMLPLKGNGQIKAKAPLSAEALTKKLNSEVNFLNGKSDYEAEGIVNFIISCKGKMLRCKIDNKTESPELDAEIVAVFNTMKKWRAGSLHGRPVDTSVLYSFKIKDGVISL